MLLLALVEGLFVLVGLTGVAFVYWPAALILAGLIGVVLTERAAPLLRAKLAEKARKTPQVRGDAA